VRLKLSACSPFIQRITNDVPNFIHHGAEYPAFAMLTGEERINYKIINYSDSLDLKYSQFSFRVGASPSCWPRLRLGLQSLSLAQKNSLLLLMIQGVSKFANSEFRAL
jgi:hypothetical protein